jgi:hypothetical protein
VTVVKITEVPGGADGSFAARVAFEDAAEYDVTVHAPGDAAAERLLAWYFEEHLRFPFLDRDKERQAVAQLADYGRDLFGQVLGGAAAHDYRRLRERSFDGCRLEVTGSAGFIQGIGQTLRGWANYHRHGVAKAVFSAVDSHAWNRIMRWLRRKYDGGSGLGMPELRRRFCVPGTWKLACNGVVFTGASAVPVVRYRYRGTRIPSPYPGPSAGPSG